MVEEALMDHAYIDENRVPEGFLKHTLSDSIRQTFVSHLLRCEECRDRVLLAEMFLNSEEACQPVPPVQVVQVPDEPDPTPPDSETTAEMPIPVPEPPLVEEPAPVEEKAVIDIQVVEAVRKDSVVQLPPRPGRVRPEMSAPKEPEQVRAAPSVGSYVPKERPRRGLESWQVVWLVIVGVMLLVVFGASVAVVNFYQH